eukprot:gene3582-3923_t
MTAFLSGVLGVAALLLGKVAAQSSTIGFVPELSSSCSSSLSALSLELEPTQCGPTLSKVLKDDVSFTNCTQGVNGLNCFDVGAVANYGDAASDLVPVYRIPPYSQCSLCTQHSGMVAHCLPLLEALAGAVYGEAVNYTAFGIANNSTRKAAVSSTVDLVAKTCGNFTDQASTQILYYQSQVLCASTDTFNLTYDATTNTLPGVLDMRALTQCGACAVLPCMPGQLCDGSGSAEMCPEGYYCPTPAEKKKCPSGKYCPEGSTEPKSCRGIASSSCDGEGLGREVDWVPLFFAVMLLTACYVYENFLRTPVPRPAKEDLLVKTAIDKSFMVNSAPVSITFEDILLVSNNTVRLTNVSGQIHPGRFTAIMGGSGAGKTSLMNVILGREAKTGGKVNFLSPDFLGRIPPTLLDRVVAFVPQTDVYLREMTVYELILHSALWRSSASLSREDVEHRVEQVLDELQLTHLKDIPVGGDGQGSSLSPGDRKKVNIALELVADPNVLFLDEPTTGIDASAALNVARIVSQLAKAGLTCVAVIHQPRAEIFNLLDDIIILVKGGRLAYQGPARFVLDYLAKLGCPLADPRANKTDFIIDLTSKPPPEEVIVHYRSTVEGGNSPSAASTDPRKVSDLSLQPTVHLWAEIWEREGVSYVEGRLEEERAEGLDAGAYHPSSTTIVPLDAPRRGFFRQLLLSFKRGLIQHFKQGVYLNDLMIHFAAGIIMGIVTSGGPLFVNAPPITYTGSCPSGAEQRCNTWIRFQIAPATFLITMILGAMVIPGAVRCFGREKEVFARESAVGANKFAYFVGKITADLPFLCVNVYMFLTPMMAIAPWRSPSDKLYGVLFCIAVVVSAMGYMISLMFRDPDAAVLTGVIVAILLNLFSGFVPSIGDGGLGKIMYTHYSARAICASELWYGMGINDVDEYNSVMPKNWKNPNYTADCLYMLLIALILAVVSYVFLLYINRRVASMD